MAHVFFSYSRSDRELARRLRRDLRVGGLDIWSDRELDLGGRWLTAISVAISQSRAVILLASPAALASKWVMREVSAAQTLGIPVIPLLAGGARYSDLPTSLAGINGVDLADGYEESVTMIVSGLGNVQIAPSGTPNKNSEARTLALITSDERLASTVAEISRSVGLVVDRPNGDLRDLLTMLASAHITLVDDANPDDAHFIAGYASGRGGWVIWLARGSEKTVPAAAGVRFSPRTAGDLEREICSAAFLPSRHWEQP